MGNLFYFIFFKITNTCITSDVIPDQFPDWGILRYRLPVSRLNLTRNNKKKERCLFFKFLCFVFFHRHVIKENPIFLFEFLKLSKNLEKTKLMLRV